ncbi:MAG: hypothetical protein ACR2OG_18110 [Gemmatimonadaceae bacterium]
MRPGRGDTVVDEPDDPLVMIEHLVQEALIGVARRRLRGEWFY